MDFVKAVQDHFELNGQRVMLRGWALGSWMNFEHFMMGMPGTNSDIIATFKEIYGEEKAKLWLDRMLKCMVGEEDIRYLKEIGINSIRIPFDYHYFMSDDAPCVFLEEGFRQLDRVVKLCEKYELFVILDMHSTPGAQNPEWHADSITGQQLFWHYKAFQDQTVWLWRELCKRYADNPWIIGYDLINEPGPGVTGAEINGFYRRIIPEIREIDPNHILFLECPDFSRDFSAMEEFEDDNIAYTVHFYPFVLDENVLDESMDDEHRMEIFTEIYDRQLKEVAGLGRPIWCGESGYEILDGQEELYSLLLRHNILLSESRGISWSLWTYKDARCMGIVIPKADCDWMNMTRVIGKRWSHHGEQRNALEVTKEIGSRYYEPLDEKLAYFLEFRVRSVIRRIAIEEYLKPTLRKISWEEMIGYPDAFSFENCDRRERIVEDIKNYIKEAQHLC